MERVGARCVPGAAGQGRGVCHAAWRRILGVLKEAGLCPFWGPLGRRRGGGEVRRGGLGRIEGKRGASWERGRRWEAASRGAERRPAWVQPGGSSAGGEGAGGPRRRARPGAMAARGSAAARGFRGVARRHPPGSLRAPAFQGRSAGKGRVGARGRPARGAPCGSVIRLGRRKQRRAWRSVPPGFAVRRRRPPARRLPEDSSRSTYHVSPRDWQVGATHPLS